MDPFQASIEEFAAEGFTHIECHCPRCRMTRLRPISWLPRISIGPTIAQVLARLRCAECGSELYSAVLLETDCELGSLSPGCNEAPHQ